MRCIMEHGKMTIIAESNFEEGYLGELLVNKMKGIATRDKTGNISKLSFSKKFSVDVGDMSDKEIIEFVETKKEDLMYMTDEEQSNAVFGSRKTGTPIPVHELDSYGEAEELKEEMVVDMIDELESIEDSMTIIPTEIDLEDVEEIGLDNLEDAIDDLEIDLDSMEINFDELDDDMALDLD